METRNIQSVFNPIVQSGRIVNSFAINTHFTREEADERTNGLSECIEI